MRDDGPPEEWENGEVDCTHCTWMVGGDAILWFLSAISNVT